MIRVLSDDTDMFVLLVYWVYRADLELPYKVQMERWDRTVQNAFSCLACMHLAGVIPPRILVSIWQRALNILLAQDFPDVLGEVDTTHTDLVEATKAFFCALYSQLPGASMGPACFKLFTKKKKKTPKVMALPPTSANLLQLALQAYLQTMLWKAADHQGPPNESADITH